MDNQELLRTVVVKLVAVVEKADFACVASAVFVKSQEG
jgi:hypothetical protein